MLHYSALFLNHCCAKNDNLLMYHTFSHSAHTYNKSERKRCNKKYVYIANKMPLCMESDSVRSVKKKIKKNSQLESVMSLPKQKLRP